MKVVHLCTHDFGGAAIAAIQLHEEMLNRKIDSVFLTLVKSRTDIARHVVTNGFDTMRFPFLGRLKYRANSALIKFSLKDDDRNIPTNKHLKNRPLGKEIFSLPYSYFNIINHPEISNADIIHLHWVSFSMIDYKKFFNSCKVNVVWTMHDLYPFTGGCHHADDCLGFETQCNLCPQLNVREDANKWWSYKNSSLRTFDSKKLKTISPSAWISDYLHRSSLLSVFENTVIPNGFNTLDFHPKDSVEIKLKLKLPTNKTLFLFNAYDIKNSRKGITELLGALKGLDHSKCALICIGNMFDLNFNDIEVIHTGYIKDRKLLSEYYNASDYFVLPSIAENLPNTIIESLLCGTPVIAFSVGGIPELINNENGILVKGLGKDRLMEAMESGLERINSFDRNKISLQAKDKFNIDKVVKAHLDLYNSFEK